jgi:hypothetical protein
MRFARRWLFPWLLAAFFALAQLPLVFQPLTHIQKWRQADTAAVTRNLAFESADVRFPRIDVRGDLTGITGMEFPAYQALAALLMRAFGSDADGIGKAVALAASLATWAALATLMIRRFGIDPWAAHASLAVSPMLFTYGSRFMPESFALMCGAVAVERFDAWWQWRGAWRLAAAGGAIALAALVRPFMVFLGLPILVGFIVLARQRSPAALAVAATGGLALAPFLAWYLWWAPHLVRAFGIDYFFMGSPLQRNLAAMTSPGFWSSLVWLVCQEYVSWQLLPLAAVGAWLLWRRGRGREDRWFWLSLTVGVPALALPVIFLLTGRHFSPHLYYLFSILPSVALCTATGFDTVRERWPRAFPCLVAAAVLALPITQMYQYRRDREVERYWTVLPQVAAKVAPGDLVAVEDRGGYAWHLHPLRRRGWVESRSKLEDVEHMANLASRGCRWVVWDDGTGYQLDAIQGWIERLRRRRVDLPRMRGTLTSRRRARRRRAEPPGHARA